MNYCLIDGDIIINRAAFAAETRVKKQVGDEVITTREITSVQDAIFNVDTMLSNINRQYPDSQFIIMLSGKDNFRKRVSDKYKANRDPSDKPLLFDDVKEYLNTFNAVEFPYIEADDAMSIIQWMDLDSRKDWMDSETVICTNDKDLNTVPGHHYDFVKDFPYWVDREIASHWFFTQMLTGDAGDNIKGVPRIGPKRAASILDGIENHPEAMGQIVQEKYQEKFGDEWRTEFLTNTTLLHMLPNYISVPTLTDEEQKEVNDVFEKLIHEDLKW